MFINKILLASALLAVSVSATPVPQTTTSPISHNPAYSCGENHNARQKDWYIVPNLDLKGHADNKDHPVWDRKFENECECGAAISEVSNTTPLFVYNSETKVCLECSLIYLHMSDIILYLLLGLLPQESH